MTGDSHYCRYYMQQCGHGLPYYQGRAHQKGHGLGNMLRGAFRSVGTLLGPTIKTEGKKILGGVLGDVMKGRNLGNSLKMRALRGVQSGAHRLLDTAFNHVGRAAGAPPPSKRPPIKRRAPTSSGRPSKVRKKTGRGRRAGPQIGRGRDIFS